MANQGNKLIKELKQLDAKEINTPLLHIREVRGRSVNEESNIHPIKQPPQAPMANKT